jgi:hypothetical protein
VPTTATAGESTQTSARNGRLWIVRSVADPGRGTREISLEDGAQGVLVSVSTDRVIRRSFDGRRPVEDGSEVVDISV